MCHFRNECVNNWCNKSSFIVLFRQISWYIVSISLFLGNSGNIRFNVKLIYHSHHLLENYIGLLGNIFSQKWNIFNICIDILVCINDISCAPLKLLRYSDSWVSQSVQGYHSNNKFKVCQWVQVLSSFNFTFGISPFDKNFFELIKLCVRSVNNFKSFNNKRQR